MSSKTSPRKTAPAKPQAAGPETTLTWEQVLAWRMQRQHLARRASRDQMLDVVGDICGLHAQLMSSAEIALWARVDGLAPEAVQRALWEERTLLKTWAVRGTLHLLPSSEYPLWQAALSTYRHYTKGVWLRHAGFTPEGLEQFVQAVHDALEGPPLTREELAVAVAELTGSAELGDKVRGSWGSVLKPAAFRGLLCFAPGEGNSVRFTRPDRWLSPWESLDPQEARRTVFLRYIAAKGPLTEDAIQHWWAGITAAQTRKLIHSLGEAVLPVSIEGSPAWAAADQLAGVKAASPAGVVRLVPAFDQYILGAERVLPDLLLPAPLRSRVYRPQAWISPVLLVDGRMVGVWKHVRKGKTVTVGIEPFSPLPPAIRDAAAAEAEDLARFLGGRLQLNWTA